MATIRLNAELVKGYLGYLDGRVVACSSYSESNFKCFLATCSTNDIDYIREKRNGKFLLNKILEETMENVYNITGKVITKQKILNAIKKRNIFLGCNTTISSLESLKNVSEDVFYLGNTLNQKEAAANNEMFLNLYFSLVSEQQKNPLTYSYFIEKNVDNFVKHRFTNKLIASAKNNEIFSFTKLLEEFNDFFKRTKLEEITKEVSGKMEDFYLDKKVNYQLINDYVDMMNNVHIENFDDALKLKNKIENEQS